MGVAWTKEQERVIEVRNKNVLVSAAAGSGKTAVLVERIVSMVCGESVDVDRLLVVTFTNAAAAEMRERVALALEKRLNADPENIHLQKQQTLIHNAQITTIHSFCQYVIRNYFHQLDLDPSFRIGDEGEIRLLKGDVLRDLLEEAYAEGSGEFLRFVEAYATGKNDKGLEELILQLYEFSVSYPYPERWLSGCMEMYTVTEGKEWDNCGWLVFLLEYTGHILSDLEMELRQGLELCRDTAGPYMYEDTLLRDLEQVEALKGCKTYGEYRAGLEAMTFARLSPKRDPEVEDSKKEQVRGIRERMKKSLKSLREKYFSCPFEETLRILEQAAPVTETLLFLTAEFSRRYREKKREKNLADFSDLEHLALQILVKEADQSFGELKISVTDAARELSERYVQIMIDEYQDSNLIQEIILNSVSRKESGTPNVFMVGDVKQSIYRFRLARPQLFMEKYHTYPRTEDALQIRIDLHKNFRSRQEILDGTNYVFARLMQPSVGGILYDAAAALYPGADMPDPEAPFNVPELLLVDKDQEGLKDAGGELTARELEARAAADRIHRLMEENQVWDPARAAFRPVRYGDIVILLRSLAGWGETYARVLTAEGIPAHTESRTGYFTTVEIQTILNLLRIVDNPCQDIPLAAVLKSMMGGFSDAELAEIKSAFLNRPFYEACSRYRDEGENEALGEKLRIFYERLEEYRDRAEYLSIHEFLWYVLEDTGYGDYLAAQPGGEQRQANMRMLVEKAVSFEATSYCGLFHFVRYIEQLQSYNEDFGEAGITGENEDAVRIMTIHKSKGLEFPVVIVGGLGKCFNRQDTRSRVVFHPDLGLGVDYVDSKRRIRTATLPKRVLQKALDLEMLGEELRILYVAFTRAREKLILLGSVSKPLENPKKRGELSFLDISAAGTYLDWILPVLLNSEDAPFEIARVPVREQAQEETEKQICLELQRESLSGLSEFPEQDEAYAELLQERLGYRYPYQDLSGLRVKLSVSELKRAGQTEEEEAGTLLYPQEEIVPYVPVFMQTEERIDAAARGTAYHRVLECIDLSAMYHSKQVKAALDELVENGKLSREMAGSVRPFDIYAFARTELAGRMTAAKAKNQLHTEQPFVIRLPAAELTDGCQSDEPILVQGMIDAWFCEEDGIVVVDYKTDYVQDGRELLCKYGKQLDYYQTALEKLTGKQVKEKVIYSFCLRETIDVPVH